MFTFLVLPLVLVWWRNNIFVGIIFDLFGGTNASKYQITIYGIQRRCQIPV